MLPCCHIIAYWESDFLNRNNRNLATFLHLESKLCGKFQCFDAIDGSIEILKMVEISKISIKMKNFKTFYESQTVICVKEIIQQPSR